MYKVLLKKRQTCNHFLTGKGNMPYISTVGGTVDRLH